MSRVAGPPPQYSIARGMLRAETLQHLELAMLAQLTLAADTSSRLLEPRQQRRIVNHSRMVLALRDFIYAAPWVVPLGPDLLLSQLIRARGFHDLDYAATQVVACGRKVTIVVIATRLWHDHFSLSQLLEMKVEAAELGTRIVLVPQRSVTVTTRGLAAREIARSIGVRYEREQVDRLVDYVSKARISTLEDCAKAVVEHCDPYAVVLSLIARGLLDVDRSAPIDAASWVTTNL